MTHLGEEALVQGRETLLAGDGDEGGEGPVVLGGDTGNLGGVLNSALDDIQGGVEDGTDGATNGTGNEVVAHLTLRGLALGEQLFDLEDAAKVTGVPEDVAPEGALQTLVHGEGTLGLDDLGDNVEHAGVLSGGGLILESDLDELEGDDDEGLGGTGGGASENGDGLGHLGEAEEVAVDLAPLIVGGELGRTLGSLHEDGRGDATVETRETGAR